MAAGPPTWPSSTWTGSSSTTGDGGQIEEASSGSASIGLLPHGQFLGPGCVLVRAAVGSGVRLSHDIEGVESTEDSHRSSQSLN
ncbi:hypothetical protein E2C01_088466 [Portunus trituberculatus]|uniref:Uncharacterized protein n=1 Tax=Portunus trituberculatus TaxID=210409 RepID=A0A5B7JAU8_PORTR|nr:hypothetical protein [Portunus trituberculatus]